MRFKHLLTAKDKTILCVDDEPFNLSILQCLLEDHFHVVTLESGIQALDRVHEINPDLVLIDWMMPEMDGLQATTLIKQQMNIPVIMLSARDDRKDIDFALSHGLDDYITKPFDEESLFASLNKFFGVNEQNKDPLPATATSERKVSNGL